MWPWGLPPLSAPHKGPPFIFYFVPHHSAMTTFHELASLYLFLSQDHLFSCCFALDLSLTCSCNQHVVGLWILPTMNISMFLIGDFCRATFIVITDMLGFSCHLPCVYLPHFLFSLLFHWCNQLLFILLFPLMSFFLWLPLDFNTQTYIHMFSCQCLKLIQVSMSPNNKKK